jgi:alginate O-acetyltransferase complex protein AlgI
MSVILILLGAVCCIATGGLRWWRKPALLGLTLLGVVWLQPDLPLASLKFVFPLLSGLLVGLTWFTIRYTQNDMDVGKRLAGGLILVLIVLLFALKIPSVVMFLSQLLRDTAGLTVSSAVASDLQWIGLSYIVLRLVSVLIEFRANRLPPLSLPDLLIYTLFPITLLAGPIDQAGRFIGDLQTDQSLNADRLVDGGRRVVLGLLKKFVIADTLALATLSPQIAGDVQGMVGAWLVAYVYALQIFFDFSGYSDIAIGLGKLAGFDLPENFNMPYLRQNLALFWQNWHMSLTSWFRAYVFIPLSRWLLARKIPFPDVLLAQFVTMTLIGFWHGVTWNFIIWGVWHALGLYLQREWAIRTRPWYLRAKENRWLHRLIYTSGALATFHYVVIGWVFFALPEPAMSLEYLRKMFGI